MTPNGLGDAAQTALKPFGGAPILWVVTPHDAPSIAADAAPIALFSHSLGHKRALSCGRFVAYCYGLAQIEWQMRLKVRWESRRVAAHLHSRARTAGTVIYLAARSSLRACSETVV